MRNIIRLVIISMLWLSSAHAMTVPEEITQEATSPNSDTNHPLPLMATWATGRVWDDQTASTQLTYTPTWQIRMIQQGHHLLPSFFMPDWTMLDPAQSANGSLNWPTYYQWPIQQAAAMNLPLTFIGTQWEQELYKDTNWFNLPAAQNPNVINPSTGSPQATLSAFGPVLPWQDVGAKWISATNQVGGTSMLAYLQQWYPNPPLVQFLSNNEAQRETASPIAGTEVENDQHYLDTWGTGHTPIFKREKLADGWTARYRSMQDSMRAQLINSTWKDNARFIAYNAFGPPHFGRWSGWMDYSQYITNRIDANPLAWDGGSPSYYLGEGGWDFQVYGPQVEAMNYDFMLKEAYALNPDFWFELSVWSGCDYWPLSAAPANDASAQTLIKTIPDYTPTRYGGMVQFGMWLTRPRVVRNFTAQVSKLADSEAFFDVLMDNVDKVYVNATLKTFWRSSDLVANTTRQHPYQTAIPLEYKSTNRMFMLTTTLDPPLPWDLKTELPVFALARVKGVAPSRQWLVYTFSPQQDRTNVQITIPNYNKVITANPTIAGSFLLVDEASGSVTSVNNDASLSDLVVPSRTR